MITIDLDSADPLFNQLVKQIKQAIENKQLRPSDALPSIRQLAADLDINAKTVAKAYRLLERDNVIESKGYRGTFVRADAEKNIQVDIKAWLNQTLADDIEKYRSAGLTDSEIRIAFNAALSNTSSCTPTN
ncbi:GntR family transcriptional regulator [Paraglaciecola sp.]|uniref:GntR family transcriptional regulator n=1 Tax=Paraglaciecola sp. TaxID=1920173 RepID=UPI00273DD743|nr:GntR family transcriptional regulator [Paraglaciecola sp.]MDP5032238.1 GntR family transcriptional regulator [Paraglaciecola sp.]